MGECPSSLMGEMRGGDTPIYVSLNASLLRISAPPNPASLDVISSICSMVYTAWINGVSLALDMYIYIYIHMC